MQADPVKYPTVQVGDRTFTVKFRTGDVIRLKTDHNIDLGEQVTVKGAEALSRTLLILQSGIAHQAAVTVEELADAIEYAQIPEINVAIIEAISKVTAQAIALQPRMNAITAQAQALAKTSEVTKQ